MAQVPHYVLDNSVAVKWVLRLTDEQHVDQAITLLDDYRAERIALLSPQILLYETAHALRRAVRRRRITEEAARQGLDLFLNLAIPTVHQEAFLRRGLELSAQYGCSFYDSIYLAVAEAANCPLVHADGSSPTL